MRKNGPKGPKKSEGSSDVTGVVATGEGEIGGDTVRAATEDGEILDELLRNGG